MKLATCLLLLSLGAFHCVTYTDEDYRVLKDTIYGEARGESRQGQMAVAHVVLNRARTNCSYWGGSSIAAVCKHPYQFGCWNGIRTMPIDEPAVHQSIDEWLPQLLKGEIPDNTEGSDHFNNPRKENASWVNNVQTIKDIGNHRFYRSKTTC